MSKSLPVAIVKDSSSEMSNVQYNYEQVIGKIVEMCDQSLTYLASFIQLVQNKLYG